MNLAGKILAVVILAITSTGRLFSDESGSQDLFATVIARVVSNYLGYEIDPFNIVLAPEYSSEDDWRGNVEVYKHGSVRIIIDSTCRSICLFDDSGSTLIFQSITNSLEPGRHGIAWLREYLELP